MFKRKKLEKTQWWLWLSLSAAVFLVLAFNRLGYGSIWHDESFSFMLADYDISEILRRAQFDVHPPLYYILLKGWIGLFGSSLIAMRMLSVFGGLIGIFLLGLLLKQLKQHKLSVVAPLFLAVNPVWIRYAQEIRMYTLAASTLLGSTYALVRYEQTKERKWLGWYALLGGFGMLLHYYAAFVLLAHGLWVLWWHLRKARTAAMIKKHFPYEWLKAWLGVALVFLPWLPTAYRQFSEIQNGFWIGQVSHTSFFSTFTKFGLYLDHWKLQSWHSVGALGLAIVISVGAWHYFASRKKDSLLRLVWVLVVVPLSAIFLLSLPPFTPVYNDRYFTLITPFIATLFAAAALWWWNYKKYGFLMVFAFAGMALWGLLNVYGLRNFNSDNLGQNAFSYVWQEVEPALESGEAVLAVGYYSYFDLYYHAHKNYTPLLYAPTAPGQYGSTSLIYDRADLHLESLENIEADGVWLLFYGTDNDQVETQIPTNWLRVKTISNGSNAASYYKIN